MLIETLSVDFSHADDRGSIVQLLHNNCNQINVLMSYKGIIRGNHYHKIATESFYVVSGSVEVSCTKELDVEIKTFSTGDFFRIRPYIVHSMIFPEDCVLVAIYDVCVEKEDGTKDIYN